MCGRYALTNTLDDEYVRFMRDILRAYPPAAKPRYNVAPSQLAPVIRVVDGERRLDDLKWGYYEAWWAKLGAQPKPKPKAGEKAKPNVPMTPKINARGETVFTNGLFKHGAQKRRCLVVASGWYEWKERGPGLPPHYFHMKDDEPMAFAGIWARTTGKDGKMQENFGIVTTEASAAAAKIHPRMPVILGEKERELWLSADAEAQPKLEKLLVPFKNRGLEIYPVSPYVNNVRNVGAESVKRI